MELTLDYIKGLELGLGSLVSLKKMSGGFSNKNYLLTTDSGRYRLRIPKYSTSLQQLYAEQEVLKWAAAKSKFPVPLLKAFIMQNNTPVSIFPYIEADLTFDIHNEKLLYNAGRALSEYHLAVEGYNGSYPFRGLSSSLNDVHYGIASLFDSVKGELHTDNPNFCIAAERLYEEIKSAGARIYREPYVSLPFVCCHGDYAPANLLSLKDEVTGIIDFECARWEPRIYDVAKGLLALEQTEGYEHNISTYFLQGYESNIKLLQQELELIPEFKCMRTLEAANRHFKNVIKGIEKINAYLVIYWGTII